MFANDSATPETETVVPAPVVEVEPMPSGTAPEVFEPMYDPAPDVHVEAKKRSLRTLLQGSAMAVLTALVLVAVPVFQTHDLSAVDWKAFALLACQAAGTALVAYIHNTLGVGDPE